MAVEDIKLKSVAKFEIFFVTVYLFNLAHRNIVTDLNFEKHVKKSCKSLY